MRSQRFAPLACHRPYYGNSLSFYFNRNFQKLTTPLYVIKLQNHSSVPLAVCEVIAPTIEQPGKHPWTAARLCVDRLWSVVEPQLSMSLSLFPSCVTPLLARQECSLVSHPMTISRLISTTAYNILLRRRSRAWF
jgi:hypothetical protein